MLTLINFFKLIRLSNILIMGLTMCAVYLMFKFETMTYCHISEVQWNHLGWSYDKTYATFFDRILPAFVRLFRDTYFVLLLLSVFFIAAGGNIINDYFDVKADRVNKPDRLIIDKYIKRRWAIILNWTFNGIGFLISLYLSIKLDNWWIVSISFVTINLLYFYSAVFKRKFLVGNIIVALLTAFVPFYVYVFLHLSTFEISLANFYHFSLHSIFPVLLYALFAFFFNFIREIIKDMADVKGDLLLKSQTLPIRFGFAKTKIVLIILYLLTFLPLLYYVYLTLQYPYERVFMERWFAFNTLIGLVGVFQLVSLFVLLAKNQRKYYLLSANLIKIAMLMGILSICFYEF